MRIISIDLKKEIITLEEGWGFFKKQSKYIKIGQWKGYSTYVWGNIEKKWKKIPMYKDVRLTHIFDVEKKLNENN